MLQGVPAGLFFFLNKRYVIYNLKSINKYQRLYDNRRNSKVNEMEVIWIYIKNGSGVVRTTI